MLSSLLFMSVVMTVNPEESAAKLAIDWENVAPDNPKPPKAKKENPEEETKEESECNLPKKDEIDQPEDIDLN